MSEQNTEASKFPQTWEEVQRKPLFTGIPDLVKPYELTVAQSALFEVTRTRINERLQQISRLLDGKKPDEMKTLTLVAELVQYSDLFYRELAADKQSWEEWTRGRTLDGLSEIFITLTRFYAEQLGKSNNSKMNTTSAESN